MDPYREPVEKKTKGEFGAAAAERSALEQEILALEKQLAEKRSGLAGTEKIKPLEQIVGAETSVLAPPAQKPVPPIAPAKIASPEAIKTDVGQLRAMEKSQQIKALVDLAFQKGVIHSVEVARNLDNPYLIDEFHDTLIDELRKELIERGRLEEI
ncbi:MAG: hypothetical protein PHW33_02040 [Candidatus Portnoybacteria bacterium]|nr:hypothetical protein [Candidatus Portnoybacteria bacterium]